MEIARISNFWGGASTAAACIFFVVIGALVFLMGGAGLLIGPLCMAAGLAGFGVAGWATGRFHLRERMQRQRQAEMHELDASRVPTLFELSAQRLPAERAWEYLAKACGVDPKDQSEASRNMVVSKLIESNPDGLESQPMLNAAVRSASLSQMLAAAYAARAWTSLLEICELNTKHELLDWGPMSSEAREQLASTLVERFPNGLEPDVAFHVESVSLSQRVEELYAAKARDERSPSTPRDREWLLER